MKHTLKIVMGALVVFSTSCIAPVKKFSSSPYVDIQEPNIRVTPMIADMEVSEKKITGSATMGFKEGTVPPLEDCKLSAIGNALIDNKADVLVEPFYVVEQTSTSISVKVTGYPAVYKSFNPKK